MYRQASTRPLGVLARPVYQSNLYPAFLDLVRRQLLQEYAEEDLRTDGLKIYTTLDPQVQEALEQGASQELARLAQRGDTGSLQLAGVMTSVGNGEVLGLLGDRAPRFQGFNRALDAERLVGSLIKPAVYLSALMQPEYSLATLISDQPFRIEFDNGDLWEPSNFDRKAHGEVPLYQALAHSWNMATARLGLDLGQERVTQTLRLLGVEDAINPYPSLFLGAQALTPFEVARFYQTIASNGFNMPLRAIREVATAQGELLTRYPFQIRQVIPAEANYLLQFALQEVMRSGTGKAVWQRLPEALHVAGKTGTSNGNRDSWFAGFSGDYLGVFWLGRDDNQPTPFTGSTGALPLWTGVFSRLPQYPLHTPRPAAIELIWFDQDTWQWTDEHCNNSRPLPVWGKPPQARFRSCTHGFTTLKGWLRSWF
jgi:penicillin-binding protein 1B